MLSTVGFDMITGHFRFTFGWLAIEDGIPFVQALVGLFAVTQALVLAERGESISRIGKLVGGFWEGVITYFTHPYAVIRAALIGLFIGVLPAVGQTLQVSLHGQKRNGNRDTLKPLGGESQKGSSHRRPQPAPACQEIWSALLHWEFQEV